MNEPKPIGIVRPESVAKKLAAIRNYECPKMKAQVEANPRIPEVLLYLQYKSMQPGGLVKFCEDLVAELPERFGTPTMRESGRRELSLQDKVTIYTEMGDNYRPEDGTGAIESVIEDIADHGINALIRGRRPSDEHLEAWSIETFRTCCFRAAMEQLPRHLAALCQDTKTHFEEVNISEEGETKWAHLTEAIWFMDDPISVVTEMMDRQAEKTSKRLASTEVTKRVFDALDYAVQERAMVRIEGDSRFGKTESVKAWCEIRPGRARLVSVPSSNSLTDLHRRVAEALGIEVSYANRAQRLKERIEFVLKHTSLFLVLDESHMLVPQNYTAATAPARLNWVRTEIVDRGLPLALVVTPQTFMPMVNRFIKKTGYAMEQFFGRNYRTVQLPNELEEPDMIAVARIHFPEFGEDYLSLIADMARMSENYLQTVEAIAKLARYIARRDRHARITVDDLEAAASEVIPRRVRESQEPPTAAPQAVTRPAAKRGTKGRINTTLTAPERAVKPALNGGTGDVNLRTCSLRGASLDRASAELVPAEA